MAGHLQRTAPIAQADVARSETAGRLRCRAGQCGGGATWPWPPRRSVRRAPAPRRSGQKNPSDAEWSVWKRSLNIVGIRAKVRAPQGTPASHYRAFKAQEAADTGSITAADCHHALLVRGRLPIGEILAASIRLRQHGMARRRDDTSRVTAQVIIGAAPAGGAAPVTGQSRRIRGGSDAAGRRPGRRRTAPGSTTPRR